jgi:hypothetical protein
MVPGNEKENRPRLSHDKTMVAQVVHRSDRHITFLDQKLEASSIENKTPPIGAPKAAAKPAAAPADINSRLSLSL